MSVRQPLNYLEFNNPIHIIWRSGLPSDPFIDRIDISRVVNQRVALLEIPDELYRVRIAGLFEINHERFIKSQLAQNEFYCDYTNGFIYFHANKEAETISVHYKGRGVILYPSSRVVHYDGTNGTETLHQVIEKSKQQILELAQQTSNFEEVLENMIIATTHTREVTDIAIQTNEQALQHIDKIKDAYDTTVLIYLPFVETYDDIADAYPFPLVGWTVQVYDTGIRYRWNGQEWVPIDALAGSIPLADEILDGLMSKELFVKLEDISEDVDIRTIVFICPRDVLFGVQDAHVVFPHDGEIVGIEAYVATAGSLPTIINIETSTDFINWSSILDSLVLIPSDSHKDNESHVITKVEIKKNDVFRLNMPNHDMDSYNLTLNIKIKIN